MMLPEITYLASIPMYSEGQTYNDGSTPVKPVQTVISPHMDIK